jgi:hypothetical protein
MGMKRTDNENRMAIGVGCALLLVVMVGIVQLGVAVHTMKRAEAVEPNTPRHVDDEGGFLRNEYDR